MTQFKSIRQVKADQRQTELDPTHQEARRLHVELFPEEYDFMYDSSVDAKERVRGINPMDSDYIKRTNLIRNKIGFKPFNVNGDNDDTFSWIYKAVKEGNIEIIKNALKLKSQIL